MPSRRDAAAGIALGAAAAVLALAAVGSSARSSGRWVVHDLGVTTSFNRSGDGSLLIEPREVAINDRGQVVGASEWADAGSSRAFFWDGRRIHYLGALPGDTDSAAVALNDRGQVVGTSWRSDRPSEPPHAFLWENGRMRGLGLVTGGSGSIPVDINERGEVAGTVTRGEYNEPYRAVIWRQGRTTVLLQGPGASNAINEQGAVVGTAWDARDNGLAFLWQNGHLRNLGNLAGVTGSAAVDLNDRGQIVGTLRDPKIQPVVWQGATWHAIQLGANWDPVAINDSGQITINGPDEWVLWQGGKFRYRGDGQATAVNERGQVSIINLPDEIPRIWQNGTTTRLPLLPSDKGGAATDLNEHDQVVGYSGVLDSDSSGLMTQYTWWCHVVVWTWQPS